MSTNGPNERPLRLLPAPPTDPPYDDELGAAATHVVDGALALSFPAPPPAMPLRLAPPALEEEYEERATPRSLLPEPAPLAHRFAQAVVEIVAGDRPVTQLSRYATLEVLDQIDRTVRRREVRPARLDRGGAGAAAARPRVTSVRVCEPADGAAEVCAVISAGTRRRALAFRLEGLDGRWQCTALQLC